MRTSLQNLLLSAYVAGACSEVSQPSYFRLAMVDSTNVPFDISTTDCCSTLLDSGTVHILNDGQIDRTLDFTDYQGKVGSGNEHILGKSHFAYFGFYVKSDTLLIITYPTGASGADTAVLRADGITITLRPALTYGRHFLHYTPSKSFCDEVTAPCAGP
jgi:hypothetical protein